jgi:predicted TIM-barrel fold metal-dependent hydrolase
MMIVDAQIHLWAKGTPSAHHQQEPYSKDQALADMDEAGVDRAVIHPVMWDPDSNELAVEAARAHPDRFAILGLVLPRPPGEPGSDRHLKEPARHARPALLFHSAA